MIDLHSRPTFGYEYETCNANKRRIADMKEDLTIVLNDEQYQRYARIGYIASNVFKVLGAFVPLVGLGRIISAVLQTDKTTLVYEVLRGLAELLGAGLFMIAIDVGVTIYREFKRHNPDFAIV